MWTGASSIGPRTCWPSASRARERHILWLGSRRSWFGAAARSTSALAAWLVQELLIAKRDLKLSRVLKRLNGFDALMIDDIGYVQQSREEMEVLFTLLAERYERGSVMITSNLAFSKWEAIFKDPMTTARGDRPPRAPQRDLRAEHPKLPLGGGQEGQGQGKLTPAGDEKILDGTPVGLRLLPSRPKFFRADRWGILIVVRALHPFQRLHHMLAAVGNSNCR